jgi:hypothetical protein
MNQKSSRAYPLDCEILVTFRTGDDGIGLNFAADSVNACSFGGEKHVDVRVRLCGETAITLH